MLKIFPIMSRRGLGTSSGTYNVRATELARDRKSKTISCTVQFLDDSQHLFDLEKRDKGQVLLDYVFQHLELVEKDYFGLQYNEEASNQENVRWLDPTKSIKKQLKQKSGVPYVLYFRIKFYVSDPSKLQEEYTRYHFFLQLKKDMVENKLIVPPNIACLLASYAVQSELGDHNPEEHGHGYLSDLRLIFHQTEEMERKIIELHKLHKGQTPADAEYNFLDHAKRLDMYGVDLHRAKDTTNTEIQLGVTSAGLVVFQSNIRINTFSWAKIVKISFKRKQFFIQLRREGHESYDSLLGFNLVSYRSCKLLWKSCVEHHTFFRLHCPRPPTRRYLFSLGSKFRYSFAYSGRTEYQTVEDGKRRARLERTFVRSVMRSPSKRFARQTVPSISREGVEEKKPPKSVSRQNGNSTHLRPYDSFKVDSHKVVSTGIEPRKAWTESEPSEDNGGFTSESAAFTPVLPTRIGYVDEDDRPLAEDEVHKPVTIRMRPDEQGRFGFNVKGGADQNIPILVSRVAPNTPADRCIPRLNEGDQVLLINNMDVSRLTHDQVVQLIRASRESSGNGDLVLSVRPTVYVIAEDLDEPAFQYVPDISSSSDLPISRRDALSESMLLLSEGLDSGATVAQFDLLYRKKQGMPMTICKLPENLPKNRYKDISPYDATRVIIDSITGDYINANYINMEICGSGIINKYIAAQGPLPHTSVDFWQMMWEQMSTLIVMLTTVVERGRVKCHQYWPDLFETVDYGQLQVTCLKEQISASFAFREFTLINTETNEERHISQMQYIAWPDHGVPEDATNFLDFVVRVRQSRVGMVDPTVVHCSAGIGRTGVLILMETAMCLIEANQPVYPFDIVRNMRDQRAMLIQNASQYRFVCEAVRKVYNDKIVQPLLEYQQR